MATIAASQPRAVPSQRIRCPRCGYDQRGVVETWKDSCPLDGVCSECGLEWRWAEVFNPRLHRPAWCVEYGCLLAFPWRVIKTLAMSFWPWRFWWRLQMHHEAKGPRLAAYVVSLLTLPYLAVAGEVGQRAYQAWRDYDVQIQATRTRSQTLTPAQVQQYIAKTGVPPPAIYAIEGVSMARAVGHAIAVPFSDAPSGFTTFPAGQRFPYSTPLSVTKQRFDMLDFWLQIGGGVIPKTMLFPAIFAGLIPVTFMLLPVTRRVCRIRPMHLGRISAYGLVWLVLAICWWVLVSRRTTTRSDGGKWRLSRSSLHRQ